VGGVNRPFVQRDLYKLVKEMEPVRMRDITAASGLSYQVVNKVMCCMRAKGCIDKKGMTHAARWFVVGPPPRDMRGKMKGSEIGREIGAQRWRIHLALAAVAQGRDPSVITHARPQPGCELDNCWPVSRRFRHWEKKIA
jgi:hypothetical protein